MQIQATELRIGNYVNEEVLGNVCISELNTNCASVLVSNMKVDRTIELVSYSISYHELRPIPLTEDILLKFGFKPFQQLDWSSGNWRISTRQHDFIVTLLHGTFIATIYFQVNVPFIHQLQNLYFVLTGEELKINL